MTTSTIKTHELDEPAGSLDGVSCGMYVSPPISSPERTLIQTTLAVVEDKFPGTHARRAIFFTVA